MKNRFKTTYKNGLKILKFDDTEIKEYEFYQQEYQLYESSISIDDKTINEIVVCNKLPFGKQGFKYFTGYKDSKKNRPLCMHILSRNKYIQQIF